MAIELTRNSLLINLSSRLRQDFVGALPPELDQALVQEAYRELCAERPWHAMKRTGWLVFPAGLSSAVGSFTANSRVVTVNAATQTYLDALPQLQATRMTIIAPDGRPYHIARWFSAELKVVLDRPYFGSTAATTACSIIKAYCLAPYYAIPEFDDGATAPGVGDTYGIQEDWTFRHFLSIRLIGPATSGGSANTNNPAERLYYSPNQAPCPVGEQPQNRPQVLHPLDPVGADFPGVAVEGPIYTGMPRFQIYPAYNGSLTRIYETQYVTTGGELSDAYNSRQGTLPYPFTTDLILSLARVKAAQWCDRNKATRAELQKTDWFKHIQVDTLRYTKLLDDAIKLDDEFWSKDTNVDGGSRNQIEALRIPRAGQAGYLGSSYMVDPNTVYLGY